MQFVADSTTDGFHAGKKDENGKMIYRPIIMAAWAIDEKGTEAKPVFFQPPTGDEKLYRTKDGAYFEVSI